MADTLIAMSGGVDSSVAALLCVRQGLDCAGVTLRLFSNGDVCRASDKTCCSLEDAEDARSVARRLGMPHYVFNFTDAFGTEVIDRFVCAYGAGRTPNPCIDCNRYMKFGLLFRRMQALGADRIVTGHYARVERSGDRWLLKKAADETKDQSYVLYALTQEQLAHTLLPLGALHKSETRRLAEENGFLNAHKRESQDICFVPDGDYAAFIERRQGEACPPGNFVDREGRVLGGHRGLIRYTVGQHRHLGLGGPEIRYVLEKRPETNEVVLGPERALYVGALEAEDFNWIAQAGPPETPLRVTARTRYHQREAAATVRQGENGRVRVDFDVPQRAVAPGQAVVLYDGDTVVGGGTIVRGLNGAV